jgi:hypothetical protein
MNSTKSRFQRPQSLAEALGGNAREWPALRAQIESGELRATYLDGADRKPIPKHLIPLLAIPTHADFRASTLAYRIGEHAEARATRCSRLDGRPFGRATRRVTEWQRFPHVEIASTQSTTIKAEIDCATWLRDRTKGPKTASKAEVLDEFRQVEPGFSARAFDRAWTLRGVVPPRWKQPGSLKKAARKPRA